MIISHLSAVSDATGIAFFTTVSIFFSSFQNGKKIDNSGSFLLLDDDANPSFFIVRSEEDLRFHYDVALDNGASEEVLDQLAVGEKIPCFWQANNQVPEWNDWSTCLVKAHCFVSDETYFYSYVPGPVLFDIRQAKIFSYHRHLEELDAEELLLI